MKKTCKEDWRSKLQTVQKATSFELLKAKDRGMIFNPNPRGPGYGTREMERRVLYDVPDFSQFDVTTISDRLKEGITCYHCDQKAEWKCTNHYCYYDGRGNPQGIQVCDDTTPGTDHLNYELGINPSHNFVRLDSGHFEFDEEQGYIPGN